MCRYDVYLTREPNAYESMALVHSRARRVVFGLPDCGMGGLGGPGGTAADGGCSAGIHSLPGTNHHYRAFRLDVEGDRDDGNGEDEYESELMSLIDRIRDLHKSGDT